MENKNRPNAKTADARQRLLETAIGMFAQKGYAGTSVREIAEQAGVSKPVLYYYFKSKGGLFLAILEMAENLQKQLLAEVLESQGTVLDRLVLLYRRVYEEVEAHQSFYKMIHGLIFGPPQGAPDYDFTRYHRHMIGVIRKIYHAGLSAGEVKKIDADDVAYMVLSLIDFCLHVDQVQPQASDPQRAERLMRIAFKGIDQGTEN
ncbi:MAG: TetR/AcrR family transcriptional regulator [Desulfobacterales bacterium]|jgi:AcrR family transcriptional regulator